MSERFQDQNFRLSNFSDHVLVVCPNCAKKATAKVDEEAKKARLLCANCKYYKEKAIDSFKMAGNFYFEAELWLKAPFKNDVFVAYNEEHLTYLESYISANLREHKDRTHFTLLEKLPKFYHTSKNREGLLKLIAKLRKKS